MDKETYIVTKAEIDAMSGTAKTHFLNPNAQRINKSLGDRTGITDFGFHLIEVPSGKESTEYHVHSHEDECVYVLSGQGEVLIGEAWTPVSAGDFIGYRAGGQAHTMKNTGSSVLKCIVVGTRSPYDVGDYPHQKKRLYRRAGQPADLVDYENIQHPTVGKK